MKRKPKGYWTKERCLQEAIKYKTRGTFAKEAKSIYNHARVYGWLDEVCRHMPKYERKRRR